MSLANIKQHLDTLMDEIKNIKKTASSGPFNERELYFIKWFEVASVLENIAKMDNLDEEITQKYQELRQKFKKNIPGIMKYRKKLAAKNVRKNIDHLQEKIFASIDIAEENLKVLPKKSYELYQDAMEFTKLFDKALNKSLLDSAKNLIKKKMIVLKNAFEVEGGRKELEKEEKALTENLQDKFKGKQTAEADVAEDIDFEKIEEKESDVSLASLVLPEEETTQIIRPKEKKQRISKSQIADSFSAESSKVQEEADISPQDDLLETPTDIGAPKAPEGRGLQPKQKIVTFPYWQWYPNDYIREFVNLRYCKACGRKVSKSGYCDHCNISYNN